MSVSSSSTGPARVAAMSSAVTVLVLSMLLGLQPVSTDLYLPALPALVDSFGSTMPQAQLTLTGLLLAFGLSQLVWGPLSDRFGRRPILLTGLSAFVVASIGVALADSMAALIGWRVLQGAAMGAGVMAARAVVRDLYQPAEGARVMSKGLSGLGLIACASGLVGGLLADWLGWRWTLSAVAVFGVGAWLVVALGFRESLHRPDPLALRPTQLLRTWRHILGHRTFWAFSLLATTSYAGLFTFLAGSSFVFIKVLGQSKTVYGLLMLSMATAYVAGTFLCRWWLQRLGVRQTVRRAAWLTLIGGSGIGLLGWAGVQSVWAIMLPFYVFMLGHGVHQPCGQSGAVGPFPQAAGAASALNGFLMMATAFAVGAWLGQHLTLDAAAGVRPMTDGLWFWSALIALTAWTLVQRHGEPTQR